MMLKRLLVYVLIGSVSGCVAEKKQEGHVRLSEVAANETVASYMNTYKGRGVLTDSTRPTPARKALAAFRYPADLGLDLVLAEPRIHQPVSMSFDHRGRLWVVQYKQYPYPQGLQVVSLDNHLRARFDKVPPAPPAGTGGADKITVFEDSNGDGRYDKSQDVITGLNIATSVILGRGRIWVLNPPYLLAYPDADGDGKPEGAPVVHLEGFGLEDTHAVANSLRWGPDGWLYGAQGSTTTALIHSAVTKNVRFLGQAIWRYHPGTRVFEVFAEGGGNTFHIEIDSKGRLYSGDNGADRGQYYKQGAYYVKNWGKHGALTNPYAFGYLPNMKLTGDKKRFTHAWIKYEGGALPEKYREAMIAINPLQSYVQLTRLSPVGSTFANTDEARILETPDHWFRPVDIQAGPDGAVYLADWYDSRLSHIDPRDTWDKVSGRIYRLRAKAEKPALATFDLSTYSGEELVNLLRHPNKWFRQQALRQLYDRQDKALGARLLPRLQQENGQFALELLWAINACGSLNEAASLAALQHPDPFVRMWTLRLAGDANQVSAPLARELANLAAREPHPEVRSQLAATAKRLPASAALPVIKSLLLHHNDVDDADIPLQLWWALEAQVRTDNRQVLALFEDKTLWQQPTVSQVLLERLMQRYALAGEGRDFAACARLLHLAPAADKARILIGGLQKGLLGTETAALPQELRQALAPYQHLFQKETLALELRQGKEQALNQALEKIASPRTSINERLTYIRILGQVYQPRAVATLLQVMDSDQSPGLVRKAALQALQRYDDPNIGLQVTRAFPDRLRVDPDVFETALSFFASRGTWARQFLQAVARQQRISPADIPAPAIRRFSLLGDPAVDALVAQLWPEAREATASEKNKQIREVMRMLGAGKGNIQAGQALFTTRCGSCHRLFNQGGSIGPDLSGYDRRNLNDLVLNTVDPNADIREGYGQYQVTTRDGRTLLGRIITQDGETITLQPPGGELISLAAGQVQEIKASPASLMPERLLDGLSEQQIRDLYAYISQF